MKSEICGMGKRLIGDKQIVFMTIFVVFFLIIIGLSYISFPILNLISDVSAQNAQQRPNIQASNVYQSHKMILGNNVKNLIITIPNEAHEPPGLLPRDLRVANQPFFPQNAVVNVGTTVTWFNGDVGHLHQIKLADSSNHVVYDSGSFPNFVASKPIKLNNTGTYTFSEAGLDNIVIGNENFVEKTGSDIVSLWRES